MRPLPPRLSLEQYEQQARDLVDTVTTLADAQSLIAREHGFPDWPGFAQHVEALMHESPASALSNPLAAFLEAGVWHGSLAPAQAILAAHPDLSTTAIHAAALLGDDAAVCRFLTLDPAQATAKGGPRNWDPLTCLCFSKYLRLDPARSAGFARAAQALLDAGAPANTGFYERNHQPEPEFESALYGAAGVAHHAELTRLLLARGADPNDAEVPYHSPEGYDNGALEALLESGKLTPDSLSTMLLRKHDWHDFEGVKLLLDHGADPNRMSHWRRTAFHQALLRDNALAIIELLLDHGARDTSALALAARRGRGDVLELFERRGIPVEFQGLDRLLAACARNDAQAIRALAAQEPGLVDQVRAVGGKLLAEFAGVGNTDGVRHLLDLGVNVAARFPEGDLYWDVAPDSTALHVAAWRARHATVKLLIERGAPVNATDAKGRTPLVLAVRACVDSYWTRLRSPESVQALLAAGASATGVSFPSGYPEVDALVGQAISPAAGS